MTLAQDLAEAEDDLRTAQIALRSAFRRLAPVPHAAEEGCGLIISAQKSIEAAMTKLLLAHSGADGDLRG